MPLDSGAKLGPYEIETQLGAGGMGAVYRARDTRLDRVVAIKVLPDALERDAQFRDRLEREARTISQLNHPNICVLYDVGHDQGVTFLVFEFLEGETLEQRIARGTLPLAEALTIALEIAAALTAAHRAGIVHRDLKPGNIMLTRAGATKLLDFGLAKAGGAVMTGAGVSLAATAPALTSQGTILGTLHYMAPEQIEGKDADSRADIFGFGAVLYEMLTGRKAFNGSSPASVIGAIMNAEPAPIATLQPMVPALLGSAIGKCLAKDPDQRWQSVRDLAQILQWNADAGRSVSASSVPPARRAKPLARVAAMSGLVLVAAAAGVAIFTPRAAEHAERRVVRFDVVPPGDGNNLAAEDLFSALSPDGRALAFVATTDNTRHLWVRRLDDTTARMLSGTDEATRPFWSPDSRSIAFFAGGKLKRIDRSGGSARIVCDVVGRPAGGEWNREGVILFSVPNSPLMRVSSAGGSPVEVTQLADGQTSHLSPQFLNDDRTFIYFADGDGSQRGMYLGALDRPGVRKLPIVSDGPAVFAKPGSLLFRQQRTLLSVDFDPVTGAVGDNPSSVATVGGFGSTVGFAVSETGVLAYVNPPPRVSQLRWIDRKGNTLGSVGGPRTGFVTPQISPDGRRIARERDRSIWLTDLERGTGHTDHVASCDSGCLVA